jgi:hypothetical protein
MNMNNLIIEPTSMTPRVEFLFQLGKLKLTGRSIPENSMEFFQPLHEWTTAYMEQPHSETIIEIRLEYFNTSSSKSLLDLLKKFEAIHEKKSTLLVRWYYEEDDEDMMEAGEDYQAIILLPFEFVAVDEL